MLYPEINPKLFDISNLWRSFFNWLVWEEIEQMMSIPEGSGER